MAPTLAPIAIVIGRIVAGSVGAIAFYLAFFLYEDEEGKWQNRLDTLWLSIYDRAKVTNSTSTALFNKISEILVRVFNRLFGKSLLSFRAAAVSMNLSLGGGILSISILTLFSFYKSLRPEVPNVILGIAIGIVFLLFSMLPTRFDKWWAIAASLAAPLCFGLAFRMLLREEAGAIVSSLYYELVLLLLLMSVGCDVLAVHNAARRSRPQTPLARFEQNAIDMLMAG